MCKNAMVGHPFCFQDPASKAWKWRYSLEPLGDRDFIPQTYGDPGAHWFDEKVKTRCYQVCPETGEVRSTIMISCGSCIECRLSYSRVWADRCVMEDACWPRQSYFVTLTYDPSEEHRLLGERGLLSLNKDDWQKFEHDVRQVLAREGVQADGLRFYMCGEYGDQNHRPHYHALLFNCELPDLVFIGRNHQGDPFFQSDLLERVWQRGFVCVCNMTWNTCAYVARYVMKKRKGKTAAAEYADLGVMPEFTLMSRRPGIGRYFIEAHTDELMRGRIVLPDSSGRLADGGRYARNILAAADPVRFGQKVIQERERMQIMSEARRSASTLTDGEFFRLRAEGVEHRAEVLERFRQFQDL